MMLTSKGRYAVMAVVDLANNTAEHKYKKPITLSDIASRQEITLPYLEQIFARLKMGKVVKSIRGPGGGYLLDRSPNKITIADIVSAVNEPIKMTRCDVSGGKKSCRTDNVKCPTHDLWEGLGDHIHSYLESISVADVCDEKIDA